MTRYDIAFIGHMAVDEVHSFSGEISVNAGSAVLCGALAAGCVNRRVAVITRMAAQDEPLVESMRAANIDVYIVPSESTTYMKVIHPTEDVDVRQIIQVSSAGFFHANDIPPIEADVFHLAGISDQEFDLVFLEQLKERGARLSADLQSFVRQVDPRTGEIHFYDVVNKSEIIRLLDYAKLDIVEAEILTGTRDLEQAAGHIAAMGAGEVLITSASGVLARVGNSTYFSPFSNRSVVGRTGRGDTTFGAYLAWRPDHSVQEALDFASALVSIKMENVGPFHGTLADVIERMTGGV
jgi:sugar/nucleoside kinase (ribokinase family)